MPGDYDIEYASPWAGANYMPYDKPSLNINYLLIAPLCFRVGKEGSDHARWERETWPYLKEIAEKYPEAGIHFRGIFHLHNS